MAQRRWNIVRKPDLENHSFLYNNVTVHYVGMCPETGVSFYCSLYHTYGVRVYENADKPWERLTQVNATEITNKNPKRRGIVRKQHNLSFKHAFGNEKAILVAHAVWMAAGRQIPQGMQIDHMNGILSDNSLPNLRCVDAATNQRDAGFLRMLRNRGIAPEKLQRSYLLRFFERIAVIKPAISRYKYYGITRRQLSTILYMPKQMLQENLPKMFNINIDIVL